ITLVTAPHDADPLSVDSALQAGPGSSRMGQQQQQQKTTTKGRRKGGHSLLQAVVGCGGEVNVKGQALVEKVEVLARDGQLERAIGLPVLGWYVSQTHPGTKHRVRRQAVDEENEDEGDFSGDYGDEYGDEYDYNYDYDYEYDDDDSGGDLLSMYDLEPDERHPEPESRVVPPLATPVFPEHLPSVYHRGGGGGGGGGGDSSHHLHFTPIIVSTPVFVPVKPTRVVVEASPTLTYQTMSPHPHPHSPLQPSHTPHLEGSITSHITETTTPLAVPTPSTLFPTRPLESGGVGVSTELGVKNFPPRVEKRIQKMAWVAGHLYKLPIPRDTFKDMEDGDTRSLRLVLKNSHGHPIGSNSWIQFNQEQQLIYALPLERDIGRYTYLLEALDSENKSATDTVMIHVQQPQRGRNFNHRFTATFILQKEYEFNSSLRTLDWKVKAVEKIAEVYGDPNAELINVRSISTNPKKLVWTNTSLSDPRHTQGCPKEELDALADVVVGSGGHGASREAKRAFEPEFNLKQVHLHLLGNCQADHRPHRPVVPTRVPEVHEGVTVAVNIPPIIRNQIDILNTTEGALFRYKVPQDTCYDTEDGASSRLKLRLLTSNLSPPANTSWLQFDPSNQEFFGIPQSSDVGKAEYILECVDKGGAKANDALFVTVLRRESRKIPSAEFSLTLSDKFSDFLQRPHRKAKLVERIAGAFGDDHPRHVSIKSFTMGSVVVAWHNNSLPSEPCPNREIRRLARTMVTENGELKPEFIEYFRPEFNVLGGSVTPSGTCLAEGTTTHPDTDHTHHQPPPEQEIVGQNEENDYLLNFIIPAVIIALMLLLAAVIACCLYRRRRYGKMRMADDRTYVSKGIPIIFAEELDDRPDPAKSPVIMKEEKPPLPPPEYQRGTSPATTNHPTPPPAAGRRRPHSGGDVADDAPSYQPPPPFTATNGASRHPRPNMPPTYRKPPTYVPP
ncbi:hypothetical protein Pmani_021268, partial [Petrolisthes manimaculis]